MSTFASTPRRRIAPPAASPWRLLREAAGLFEFPRLALALPTLATLPRGTGPVLVLPGFGASDASTLVLRSFLGRLGYDVHGWGLGTNGGHVERVFPRVRDVADRVTDQTGLPVALVGWSLGGYLARELARDRPEHVCRVITLGTPVVGGPKYTAVGRVYAARGVDLDAIEVAVDERARIPIRQPITAIYSKGDAVVAWRACIDETSPDVEHVVVTTTHLGLGFSPDVYRIVATRLARPSSHADAPGARHDRAVPWAAPRAADPAPRTGRAAPRAGDAPARDPRTRPAPRS